MGNTTFFRNDGSPMSKLCVLKEHKRGGLEGRTKRRTVTKTATVASDTYLKDGVKAKIK